MKKFALNFNILLAITMLLLASCSVLKGEKKMIELEKGIYHDKNWDDPIGSYVEDVVSDKNTAIDIANAIFTNSFKNETAQGYVPQTVFYDEQDNIWIVSFWQDSEHSVLGGDCSIALNGKDGRVLRIWFGE